MKKDKIQLGLKSKTVTCPVTKEANVFIEYLVAHFADKFKNYFVIDTENYLITVTKHAAPNEPNYMNLEIERSDK